MGLFDRAIATIEENKQKVKEGYVNSIPHSFSRFSEEFPGIEKKNYYICTASTKIGKSQLVDELFVHSPLRYAYQNQDKIDIKIFYFTLEMSVEQKALQIMSNILWNMTDYRVRATPKDLRSVRADKELPESVIGLLKSDECKEIYDFYESHIAFISDIRNPTGIWRLIDEYAKANGVMHKKKISWTERDTGRIVEREVDDYYEPYNPNEYVIIIVDHMSLLSTEKGGDLRDSMVKLSGEYFIDLRNKYKYIPVAVLQQKVAQESNENMKLGKLKPTLDGCADAPVVARDGDMVLGLYSPFRHGIETYEKYDCRLFRDNLRFLELIAGREGGGGNICPLLFDGGVNHFSELPLPNDVLGLAKTKKLLERMQSPRIEQAVN